MDEHSLTDSSNKYSSLLEMNLPVQSPSKAKNTHHNLQS
jgi:hypothetical protein